MDPSLLTRYLKVEALAREGSPGERQNAQRVLRKLQERYPGIEAAAARHKQAQEVEEPDNSWPNGWTPPKKSFFTGNWESLFAYVQNAATAAYGVADAVIQAQLGVDLAEEVRISSRLARNGKSLSLTAKVDVVTYMEVRELTDVQWSAFRTTLLQRLEEEIDGLFGEGT